MQGGIEVETCYPSPCVVLLAFATRYIYAYSYRFYTDVPHATTEDRVYNGLFIPKGARDITARVLKMIADYYLIRCLVDWKYLVGRVQTVFVAWPLILLMMRRAITRDPDVYPEPEVFKPERFLNLNGTLRDGFILTSVFGFGKRVCPGRHFADTTLFIVAATVL